MKCPPSNKKMMFQMGMARAYYGLHFFWVDDSWDLGPQRPQWWERMGPLQYANFYQLQWKPAWHIFTVRKNFHPLTLLMPFITSCRTRWCPTAAMATSWYINQTINVSRYRCGFPARKMGLSNHGWFINLMEDPRNGLFWGYPYFRKPPSKTYHIFSEVCNLAI